mgnify:CR=1 FL=1
MNLSALLHPDRVKIDLKATDKAGAITELMDFLVSRGALAAKDREAALKAVLARETSLSTGMEHGVALPHGSVDCVEEPTGALGISPKGIEFASLDGKRAHLIVCLLVPRHRTSRHIRTLAGIARLLNNESLRNMLLTARTAEESMAVIGAVEASEGLDL